MSITGIVLFILFLFLKSLLKKRSKKQQLAPSVNISPRKEQDAVNKSQYIVQEEDSAALPYGFFLEEDAEDNEIVSKQRDFSSEAADKATLLSYLPVKAPLSLDFSHGTMLQTMLLAEIVGRPKAQRRISPYFRP